MRNYEVLIRDMNTHFGFLLNDYTIYYPLLSQFAPQNPLEGVDGKT